MPANNTDWSATKYFEELTQRNLLARSENFVFCRVSGLEGFEEALQQMQTAHALVCVSDIADGYTELQNSPRTRRVKTVFMAMRHRVDDMERRLACMETMRELFRQFMTMLTLEKTRLEENYIFLDPRITFNEVERYFFSGCACAYFQIGIDVFTDLRYNPAEWHTRHDLWVTACESRQQLINYVRDLKGLSLANARAFTAELPFLLVSDVLPDVAQTHETDLDAIHASYVRTEHGHRPTGATKIHKRL